MFQFSKKSKEKLDKVDERLQTLMYTAITNSPYDFKITDGMRTITRQKELVAKGLSRTYKSYHLVGKAVDIAILINDQVSWHFPYYKEVADHIKEVAQRLGYTITWGGDWKRFVDGCHFQIED